MEVSTEVCRVVDKDDLSKKFQTLAMSCTVSLLDKTALVFSYQSSLLPLQSAAASLQEVPPNLCLSGPCSLVKGLDFRATLRSQNVWQIDGGVTSDVSGRFLCSGRVIR